MIKPKNSLNQKKIKNTNKECNFKKFFEIKSTIIDFKISKKYI